MSANKVLVSSQKGMLLFFNNFAVAEKIFVFN
jgi:hypothetical protein